MQQKLISLLGIIGLNYLSSFIIFYLPYSFEPPIIKFQGNATRINIVPISPYWIPFAFSPGLIRLNITRKFGIYILENPDLLGNVDSGEGSGRKRGRYQTNSHDIKAWITFLHQCSQNAHLSFSMFSKETNVLLIHAINNAANLGCHTEPCIHATPAWIKKYYQILHRLINPLRNIILNQFYSIWKSSLSGRYSGSLLNNLPNSWHPQPLNIHEAPSGGKLGSSLIIILSTLGTL